MAVVTIKGRRREEPVLVPEAIAVCPECRGRLVVEINCWETDTGIPEEEGVEVDCVRDDLGETDALNPHRWWQGEWIDVLSTVRAWARANLRKVAQP